MVLVTYAFNHISPRSFQTRTVSPVLIPRAAASSGCMMIPSSSCPISFIQGRLAKVEWDLLKLAG
jgi:hypothetical protein